MPPSQQNNKPSIFGTLEYDVKTILNETVSNAGLFWLSEKSGLNAKIFMYNDGELVSNIKTAAHASLVNRIGSYVRTNYLGDYIF